MFLKYFQPSYSSQKSSCEMWDVRDVGYSRCGMLRMLNVHDVGCLGFGMCLTWDNKKCGMFGMWVVWNLGYSVYGMFMMCMFLG